MRALFYCSVLICTSVRLPMTSSNNTTTTVGDSLGGSKDIDQFLAMLENVNKDNCKQNKTEKFDMSGIVAQYGTKKFKAEAETTVRRANMLTRMWRRVRPEYLQNNEDIFRGLVRELLDSHEFIFGAGNCYEEFELNPRKRLFCPYISKPDPKANLSAPSAGRLHTLDLSSVYNYTRDPKAEWFHKPRQKANEVIESYLNGSTQLNEDGILEVAFENGHWSKPYFDCEAGNIWMMTYTVGFFGYDEATGAYRFKGTSGIDIELQKVDIDQCPKPVGSHERNEFADTHKCNTDTTRCVAVAGEGFQRGAYKCVCQPGYYFPNTSLPLDLRYFNGSDVEKYYALNDTNSSDSAAFTRAFSCIRCPEHCDNCTDGSPCVAEPNWELRSSILGCNLFIMLFIPALVYYTIKHQNVKVMRAASPVLLCIILLGATLIYCTVIVGYFELSAFSCAAKSWLREIGFCLSYGALLLKTWRISVVFRVRSAQRVKISDLGLIKRLGIFVAVCVTLLSVRTAADPQSVVTEAASTRNMPERHTSGLKAFQCSFTPWDWCFAAGEFVFLIWGIRLCVVVRKAPSEFNESRFISWAIYNETLLSIFLNVIMYFVRKPADPDLAYLIHFLHIFLTTTVTLSFLFGSKMYMIYKLQPQTRDANAPDKAKQGTVRFAKSNQRKPGSIVDVSPVASQFADHGDEDDKDVDKGLLEEFKRLYFQVEALKHKNMKMGNRHLLTPKSTECNNVVNSNASPVLDGLVKYRSRMLTEPYIRKMVVNLDDIEDMMSTRV